MLTPDIDKLKPAQCREVVIKKRYPEFYKYLNNTIYYPDNISFSEKVYWYFNNIVSHPTCPCCGNKLKFINNKIGYATYCSKKCSNKAPEKIQKTKDICIKKYGGVAPICSSEVKAKMADTMMDRYGVINCQLNSAIYDKTKTTMITRYGGQGNASKELKQKYIDTCIKQYGVTNTSMCDSIKEKLSLAKRANVLSTHKHIIEYIDNDDKLMCKCRCPHSDCDKCNDKFYIINPSILTNRISHNIELCTHLLPYNSLSSSYEVQLCQLLDEYNIEYQTNVRSLISKELDIYIPSKNIAIEFNGVFWHSDKRKYQKYHINKFNECIENGIQLLSIWEDQYITKYDIVKSLILSKLGVYKQRIYARNCIIEKVTPRQASEFYDNNHIQGRCGASVHYGLVYNNEIIAMMSFGHRSIGNNNANQWELIRYCTKLHTQIIGGATRLFKLFVKDIKPECVVSWSSNDISNGELYKILGFKQVNQSMSYWYIRNDMKRYHRSSCSRSKMIDKGIISENDDRTESQIMNDLGFIKIYDTGQTKWIYNI